MQSLVVSAQSSRDRTRAGAEGSAAVPAGVVVPALNTILAVRDHAPAEIEELDALIQSLHHRLGVAYARRRLLEQLLAVIRDADAGGAAAIPGMAVVR